MSRRTLDTDQVVDPAAALADSESLNAVTLTPVAVLLGVRQPPCTDTSTATTPSSGPSDSGAARSWPADSARPANPAVPATTCLGLV
jgi:hypothetical protein